MSALQLALSWDYSLLGLSLLLIAAMCFCIALLRRANRVASERQLALERLQRSEERLSRVLDGGGADTAMGEAGNDRSHLCGAGFPDPRARQRRGSRNRDSAERCG